MYKIKNKLFYHIDRRF